jgi:tetratricopeptide (TPR) repeat protein
VEPAQALDAVLRALGLPGEQIPPGTEERAGLYRSVLAQFDEPLLVIADNASSETQARLLLPGPGPHRVVVTSRHTLAALGARLLDVTVLGDEDGVALLEAAVRAARPDDGRVSDDPIAAVTLAGICGGLPLALQIVAALLKADRVLSVRDLADELACERVRLEGLRYDDGSGAAAPSVAAAFELSYRRLDEISARVFRLLPTNPGPDFSTETAAVLADLPIGQVRRLLGDLAKAHLIEAAPYAPGRWQMHDLLRLYARQMSDAYADDDSREQARDRLLSHYHHKAQAADDHLRALLDMTVPDDFTDREAALAWLDAERINLVAAVTMAEDTGVHDVAIALSFALGYYLNWRRHFDDLLIVTATSLKAGRQLGRRVAEGGALTNLGDALLKTRRFDEAITVLRDAASIFRETGSGALEGMALTNLGMTLVEVRRFDEAIATLQEATAIFRKFDQGHSEGLALNNLGLALKELRRFDEAITAHRDAAAIYRQTGDRHLEGSALNNLGSALQGAGQFAEAITAHREAVAIYRETGDRHLEGSALNNLGVALQGAGQFAEAMTAHREAVAIYRGTGDRHGEASAMTNLGLDLQQVGRNEEAVTLHQAAAALFRDIGDQHGEASALTDLGLDLQQVGQSEEAVTLHQAAAALFRDIGDRHQEGMALGHLGSALERVNRPEDAAAAYRHAAALFRETDDPLLESMLLNSTQLFKPHSNL